MTGDRYAAAIAAIDAANAADPVKLTIGGTERPKELAHAEMMTEWVTKLAGEPSEALLLAARAHHIRRWEVPRSSYPEGRSGYLRWRIGLHDFHANIAAGILRAAGYDDATIDRVSFLIHKKNLATDSEVQTLEDALCLVFLETQFDELSGRLAEPKMNEIIRKTWKKMSPAGQERAAGLVTPAQLAVLQAALASA